MRSVFRTMRLLAALTALVANAALAIPLSGSDQYFDFTPGYQLLPGDELTSVTGILSFADFVVPPSTLTIDVFDSLNGGGALVDSTTLIVEPGGLGFGAFVVPANEFPGFLAAPAILDGTFSIGIREIAGHIDVQSLSVFAVTREEGFIELTPQAVTEPTTIALLGFGLAGVGFVCSKQLQRSQKPPHDA